MKIKIFTTLFLITSFAVFSQKDSAILFSVDGEAVSVLEFKKYTKKT